MACCCSASPTGSPASPNGKDGSPPIADDQARRLLPQRSDTCVMSAIARIQRKTGLSLCPRPTPSVSAPPPKQLVRLNIYHLIDEVTNLKFLKFGFGVFHTGVIVYGIEWSFGESVEGQETGLFCVAPGNAAGVVFKTVDLGYTDLSPEQVDTILHRLETEWKSSDYHVLHQNCNHFAARFCELLSTLEKLEVPPWCNRAARWSDKIVPKSLASWALRNMDDYTPPPLASTRGVHPNIGELPTSIIPLQWYRSAALRRAPRYAIMPPSTAQSGFAPPRREAPPRTTVNASTLSTAQHLQSTPPPPGKADVLTPEPSNNTGRMPVLTHDSGSTIAGGRGAGPPPAAARRLDEGFDSVLVPHTRGGVRMPDFNRGLHQQQQRTGAGVPLAADGASSSDVGSPPAPPVAEEASVNRGAESKQPTLSTTNRTTAAAKHLRLSTPPASTTSASLAPPPPAPGTTGVADDSRSGLSAAAATSNTLQTPLTPSHVKLGHAPSPTIAEEAVAFTDDIHLVDNDADVTTKATPDEHPSHLHQQVFGIGDQSSSGATLRINDAAGSHQSAPELPEVSVRELAIPFDTSMMDQHMMSDAFSLSPPALARSGLAESPQAGQDDVGAVPGWSTASRSLSPSAKHRGGAVLLETSALQRHNAMNSSALEDELASTNANDDVEASPFIGALAATTGTIEDGECHSKLDDHRTVLHQVDTVPIHVEGIAALRGIVEVATDDARIGGDNFHAFTRTASFTRPSVASVYSTASGSPHSQSPADMDTPGARTEDATIFTEA
jgi:hypothetical protein